VVTDVAGLFSLNLRGRSLGIVPADGWGSILIPRIAAIGMLSVRQASWRVPAGVSPVQVRRSSRLVVIGGA
jgi:hypothetical protein